MKFVLSWSNKTVAQA